MGRPNQLGDTIILGKNLNRNDGIDKLRTEIDAALINLMRHDMKLKTASITLSFIYPGNGEDGYGPYEDTKEPVNIRTDQCDLDRFTDYTDIYDHNFKEFLLFLKSKSYDLLKNDDGSRAAFISEFRRLFHNINSDLKLSSDFDWNDYNDINEILDKMNIGYTLRSVSKRWQLMERHVLKGDLDYGKYSNM